MSVLLGQVGPGACRWIVGEPRGAATKMCGRKVKGHGSWCAQHYKKVFHSNQGIAGARFNWYAKAAGYPRYG